MDLYELGRYLRDTREARELTLEDAENALRIRRRILESFEQGVFSIPGLSGVQIRGFIRNYARYLGLNGEQVVEYYDVALTEDAAHKKQRRKTPQATRPQPERGQKIRTPADLPAPRAARAVTDTNPSLPAVPDEFMTMGDAADLRRRRRRNSVSRSAIVLASLAAISVIGFVVYELLQRPASLLEFEPLPDIIITETSTATYTPLPTSTQAELAFQPTALVHLTQVYEGQGVMVSILTQQRTWIRLEADGQERFVGDTPPGTEITVGLNEFIQEVTLTASNAEALLVTYNGVPQRSFGGRGQRLEVTFLPDRLDVSSGSNFEPTLPVTATPPPTSQVDVGALIEAQTPTQTEGPSPTPSLTYTPSPTEPPTATATWTSIPTNTPTLTATIGPSPTDTPSPTATLTLTPSETAFPTAVLPMRITATPSPTKSG